MVAFSSAIPMTQTIDRDLKRDYLRFLRDCLLFNKKQKIQVKSAIFCQILRSIESQLEKLLENFFKMGVAGKKLM